LRDILPVDLGEYVAWYIRCVTASTVFIDPSVLAEYPNLLAVLLDVNLVTLSEGVDPSGVPSTEVQLILL